MTVEAIEAAYAKMPSCQNQVVIEKVGPTIEKYKLSFRCSAYDSDSLNRVLLNLGQLAEEVQLHKKKLIYTPNLYSENQYNYLDALEIDLSSFTYGKLRLETLKKLTTQNLELPARNQIEDLLLSNTVSSISTEQFCKYVNLGSTMINFLNLVEIASSIDVLRFSKQLDLPHYSVPMHEYPDFEIQGFTLSELITAHYFFSNLTQSYSGHGYYTSPLTQKMLTVSNDTTGYVRTSYEYWDKLGLLKGSCLISKVLDEAAIQQQLMAKALPVKWEWYFYNPSYSHKDLPRVKAEKTMDNTLKIYFLNEFLVDWSTLSAEEVVQAIQPLFSK